MKTLIKSYKLPFLDYLADIRGYSDLTVKTYAMVLDDALNYVVYEDGILNLTPYRIKIAPLNAKTISKKLSALRSFVKFMNDKGEKISLKGDNSIKVAKTLPKPLSHVHIMQALEQADKDEELIVVMLYTLGLRISELTSVKLENIQKEWIIVRGKGNKERQIPLLEITSELIEKYKNEKSPTMFLFEKDGAKLSENTLRYKLTRLFKKIGIHASPHMLRHSYATSLLNNDARIADVSELLGHSSMATTQIYTKLSSSIKMKNYQAAHPLALGEK